MRQVVAVLVLVISFLFSATLATAQDGAAETHTVVDVRVAEWGGATDASYGILEVYQTRGRWVLPHVVVREFRRNGHEGNTEVELEGSIGGGAVLFRKEESVSVAAEMLYSYSRLGEEQAHYLQPLARVSFSPRRWVEFEGVVFPFLSLGQHKSQWIVLEKARADFKIGKSWKLGGGGGATEVRGRYEYRLEGDVSRTLASGSGSLAIGYHGGFVVHYNFHK